MSWIFPSNTLTPPRIHPSRGYSWVPANINRIQTSVFRQGGRNYLKSIRELTAASCSFPSSVRANFLRLVRSLFLVLLRQPRSSVPGNIANNAQCVMDWSFSLVDDSLVCPRIRIATEWDFCILDEQHFCITIVRCSTTSAKPSPSRSKHLGSIWCHPWLSPLSSEWSVVRVVPLKSLSQQAGNRQLVQVFCRISTLAPVVAILSTNLPITASSCLMKSSICSGLSICSLESKIRFFNVQCLV